MRVHARVDQCKWLENTEGLEYLAREGILGLKCSRLRSIKNILTMKNVEEQQDMAFCNRGAVTCLIR